MQHPENKRIQDPQWKKWGPYLSERQWGTVREDYSDSGSAWNFFPHDHARSRAYRWGEDGIAGISDSTQRICFAFAFWNGKDEILKERLFGLTGLEGNRNEDVKEYYFYADATPSASYLKYIYKYPQQPFPYTRLIAENANLAITEREFELVDTAIFSYDQYFSCTVEYAKAEAEDILIKVTIENRSVENEEIHILPTSWFRNTWAWDSNIEKPNLFQSADFVELSHPFVGDFHWFSDSAAEFIFTENETNATRLFGLPSQTTYVKDAFHEWLIDGRKEALNPDKTGTKAAAHIKLSMQAGQSQELKFRLRRKANDFDTKNAFENFEELFTKAKAEADIFYRMLQVDNLNPELSTIQRQAWAGLIWGKQFYEFNIKKWLNGDTNQFAPPAIRKKGRNAAWTHIDCQDIISMPDKWEYPWFAAWDTAFHAIPFAHIDVAFAKQQVKIFIDEKYMSMLGQIPAYEWAFGDVNPPVTAFGAWKIYTIEKHKNGNIGDTSFLQSIYGGLARNYQWWLTTQSINGEMLFGGGFMGLDNVGAFDRGKPLPNEAKLVQADSAAWMALFSINMMQIALELSANCPFFEQEAIHYVKQFVKISAKLNENHWNDKEGVYGDFIRHSDGKVLPIPIRSIVGLSPIFATDTLSRSIPNSDFLQVVAGLASENADYIRKSVDGKWLFTAVPEKRLNRMYYSMADESRYLSKFGIRSLSKEYELIPFQTTIDQRHLEVKYRPAESETADFGENSNWRGPIWMPVNYMLVNAFYQLGEFYGTKSNLQFPHFPIGRPSTFTQIAKGISERLIRIFEHNESTRNVYEQHHVMFERPDFNENILFYEYFDGDTGRGCGASHQTGWTALISDLIFMLNKN